MEKLVEIIERMEDVEIGDFRIEVFGSEVVIMNKNTKRFAKVYPGKERFFAEEGEDLEEIKKILVLAGYEPIERKLGM